MKRLRADETSKDHQQHHQQHHQQQQPSNNSVAAAAAALGLAYSKPDGMQSGLYAPVAYGALGGSGAGPPPPPHQIKQAMPIAVGGHAQIRTVSGVGSPPSIPLQDITAPQQQQQSPSNNFQRLKVEDALSYLDLVKYKFGSKPQVYNDFLDIMKEFKSQSIDTPGVIQRVSNLFKGFPELIVGFNTFLPPGYKIEVQRNDQGYAFQVSVSMPSPTGTLNSGPQEHRSAMILKGSGTINMAGQNQPPPPPPQPVVQPPPPPPVIPPVPPAAPQAPPVAQPPAPSHLPTAFGGGGGGGTPSYGSLSLSAAQAAVTHAMQGHTDTPQNQPVEFNHAINYVNKIKNRFQGQPEKYKKFLEILHTYQKEQRTLKESSTVASGMKHLTEQEVYSQVAKLFENQSDLLAEFGQFLPDATSHINQVPPLEHSNSGSAKKPLQKPYHRDALDRHHSASHKSGHVSGQVKRSPPYSSYQHRDAPPPKKHKLSSSCRDVSLSEAGKYGTLNDYAFFDKVRKAVRSQDVYNNFLRCLTLFNQEIVSKSELVQMATPFLGRAPELLRWLREFLGPGGGGGGGGGEPAEAVPLGVARAERPQGEHALEIDLATAKRLGASYCIIPKAQEGLKCSGRTQLCKEVLNDQWVSFPTWSEDSTFVSSRKTQYEEYMYRCEDERFELDVVIEVNASAIRALEGVLKKLGRMGQEDAARHKLDDCLGGTSPTQNQRAIRRIYGDKAQDIIDGLKKSPAVAVPVVLKRLKVKEEEWREAQKGFNKVWREQNEKYYLKSLDHQGINFKQTDVKALRYKSLFNEVETAFDERHEQNLASAKRGGKPVTGPHIVLPYRDRTVLDDATNLLIHHLKRQTGVQKSEKKYIKYLLKRIVPDLFHHPKQQLSDDERDASDFEDSPNSSPKSDKDSKGKDDSGPGKSLSGDDRSSFDAKLDAEVKEEDQKLPAHALTSDPEEAYTLLMASNNWYIFLRLHAILCERLAKIYERAVVMATEEMKYRSNRKDSTAIVLRLKPKPQIEIEDYYPAFLDMVKNLLDGNMDATAYEDTLREMFGIYAYVAFTLDKVVSYAIRQLQYCVTERTAKSCTELFVKERKRGAAGGLCCTAHKRAHLELAYQRACEELVHEENCFKIFIYKRDCRMTIELLDIEPEDGKKVDEAKKWSEYKERFADVTLGETKPRTPVYLDRNMRLYQRRAAGGGIGRAKRAAAARNHQANRPQDEDGDKSGDDLPTSTTEDEHNNKLMNSNFDILDAIGKKLNERAGPPERRQSDRRGFDVDDDQQCKFNMQDSKIMFTVTKDSYLYNISAFHRARKSHPSVTKRKSGRFRQWLRRWGDANISDAQSKRCVDWLMGRGGDVVPNRTRVLCDNDVSRTPYAPFNRYRVERLASNGGGGGVATPAVSEVAGPAPA